MDEAKGAFGGLDAMEAKAEFFIEEAIEQMTEIARNLVEPWDEPISKAQRHEAELCAETFDRLEQQLHLPT